MIFFNVCVLISACHNHIITMIKGLWGLKHVGWCTFTILYSSDISIYIMYLEYIFICYLINLRHGKIQDSSNE